MEWMPIESAPKDEHILLRVKTMWNKSAEFLCCGGYWLNGFWVIYNADEAIQRVEPAHWQPLPPPPNAVTGRSDT